jgi:hypothetical protein
METPAKKNTTCLVDGFHNISYVETKKAALYVK